MRIRNADGGEVAACGNATRCVAALLMREKGAKHAVIETAAGLLDAEAAGDGEISVDMGRVSFDWRDIPLAGSRGHAAPRHRGGTAARSGGGQRRQPARGVLRR